MGWRSAERRLVSSQWGRSDRMCIRSKLHARWPPCPLTTPHPQTSGSTRRAPSAPSCTPSKLATYQPDSHPSTCLLAPADKREYAARTIRPKLHAKLPEFLEEFPPLEKQVGVFYLL